MYTVLLVIHSLLVLFLIVLVLIQRTGDDSIGGLGGGGGGNQFLTGRAQANLLTRTTAILAGAFMATSLTLAIMASHMTGRSIIDTVPEEQAAPVQTKQEAPAAATKEAPKEKKAPAPTVPKPE